jgi:hypothetical protein
MISATFRAFGFVVTASVSACSASVPPQKVVPMRSYVLGTLGDRELDLRDVCGDTPVRTIAVAPSAGSALLGILTLGFYTPREVHVTCGASR